MKIEGFTIHERLGRGLFTAAKTLPLLVLTGTSLWTILGVKNNVYVRRMSLSLAVVGLTPIAYSIWVGGDAWDDYQMLNRYVAVGTPALTALFFIALGMYMRRTARDPRGLTGRSLTIVALLLIASTVGVAALDPPSVVSPKGLAVALVVLSLATAVVSGSSLVDSASASGRPRGAHAVHSRAGALTLVTATATSAYAQLLWSIDAGLYVATDQRQTDIGLEIRDVTTPDAVIATHWAGAPAYYAQRSMVDLLGKSDRTIATGPPAVDRATGEPVAFFPGHSKFDAQFSLQELKPDVVIYLPLVVDDSQLSAWGYKQQCTRSGTELYLLTTSLQIHWDRVSACF